jgi:hypothetical protein
MGLLDSLFKTIEDGGVEKTLNSALEKLETGLDRVTTSVEKLADAPEKAVNRAEAALKQTGKAADVITKSEP